MKWGSDYEQIVRAYLRARRIQTKAHEAVLSLEPSAETDNVVIVNGVMRRPYRAPHVPSRDGFWGRLGVAANFRRAADKGQAAMFLAIARSYRLAGMARLP